MAKNICPKYDPTLYDYFNGGSSSCHHHYKPENLVYYQIDNKRKELPKSVVKLIKLIFDKDEMEKYMKKNKFDSNRIKYMSENGKEMGSYSGAILFIDRPMTTNPNDLKNYINFISDLGLIRDAYNIMSECSNDQNTYYHYYKKLNTKICPLDEISSEYRKICKYIKNTHSPKHYNYTLDVKEIFKISKKGAYTDYKKYKKLGNRKLLWHGSRPTNFPSILSKGLQIKPKDAPKNGSMFGNGIYFTDTVSKSANYCKAEKKNPYGLLLLVEVALGKNKTWHNREMDGKIKELPHGYNSVKGCGKLVPDANKTIRNEYNVKIPLGKLIPNENYSKKDLHLEHNEYIVYNTDQFLLQYLILVKFNFEK